MGEGPLAHVRVVLVRPQQPGNVGVAARAIANHGVGGLTLVSPEGFDPERARWMAPGAASVIDQARFCGSVLEAVDEAGLVVGTTGRSRRWRWPVLDPPALAEAALAQEAPVCLLFGPEDKGLSNEDLALCHAILSLPVATHASLNLGQAVTVTCAGLLQAASSAGVAGEPARRQRPRRGDPDRAYESAEPEPLAPVGRQAELVALAATLLQQAEYLPGRSEEQVRGSLYRLLGRAEPTVDELNFLFGMAKSLAFALKARSGP